MRIDRFADVVAKRLPAGARILEIGAGDGILAERLAKAYDVTAIDRKPRGTFPATFDAIVAQLVLHHVDDLGAALEKVSRLLRRGGFIAVDDYGWERSDDPEFRADRSDLLTSETMLAALRDQFNEAFYADHAYFDEGLGSDRLGFTFVGYARSS